MFEDLENSRILSSIGRCFGGDCRVFFDFFFGGTGIEDIELVVPPRFFLNYDDCLIDLIAELVRFTLEDCLSGLGLVSATGSTPKNIDSCSSSCCLSLSI